MDSTNLTEYCEYNARKAAEKRGVPGYLRSYLRAAARDNLRQVAAQVNLVVIEHDASPSVRARIRNFFGREP